MLILRLLAFSRRVLTLSVLARDNESLMDYESVAVEACCYRIGELNRYMLQWGS